MNNSLKKIKKNTKSKSKKLKKVIGGKKRVLHIHSTLNYKNKDKNVTDLQNGIKNITNSLINFFNKTN